MSELPITDELRHLAELAESAAEQAYVPYSKFPVGAALLCSDGTTFTGCNVEIAAYSATICAERPACAAAVAAGHRSFSAIAVYVGVEHGS
ncbi:MAG: cytidine deaminase, partial [Thermoleophilia bacterium]|nr:cytidine deaminase [Thermoleophilia bacterium]